MIKMRSSDFLPRNLPNSSVDISDLLPRKWKILRTYFLIPPKFHLIPPKNFLFPRYLLGKFLGSYLANS